MKGLGRDQSINSKHSIVIMKKIFAILFGVSLSVGAMAQNALAFDVNAGVKSKMTVYDGSEVNFTAYERLFYVANVEDSTYQYLNVYVPDGATQRTPIFLRTYVGGYMASPAAQPQAGDATGRALKEGYVVAIPGTRGRNSSVVADKAYAKTHKGVKKGLTVYTGRAPKAILDLKAAIRYLRHFDKQMPGDAERIITDGTSAGGAMSALTLRTMEGNILKRDPISTVFCRQQHTDFTAEAKLTFAPQSARQLAGFALLQNEEYNFVFGTTLLQGRRAVVLKRTEKQTMLVGSALLSGSPEQPLRLKIEGHGRYYDFLFAEGNGAWQVLARGVDAVNLSTHQSGGFIGACIDLYATSAN